MTTGKKRSSSSGRTKKRTTGKSNTRKRQTQNKSSQYESFTDEIILWIILAVSILFAGLDAPCPALNPSFNILSNGCCKHVNDFVG